MTFYVGFGSVGSRRRPLTFWKSGKIRDLDASSQPQRCWVGKKSFEQHFNTILGDLLEDPNANPNRCVQFSHPSSNYILNLLFKLDNQTHP